jgi:hypothetical protein
MPVSHSVRLVLFALIAHITLGFSPPQLFTSLSKNKFPDAIVSRNSALFDSSPVQRYEGDLDTDMLYVQSKFPINPFDLVKMAKDVVCNKGIGLKDDGECLADDFVFRAAFVETPKDEFFQALKSFKLEDSFDLKQQYFGWTVDPLQTNRVYFFNRQEATFVKDFMGAKADNKHLILPPQCYHVDFNDDGKVTEFGFYVVDRAQGNTGGLGGAFAFFYGVGRPLPFPEGKPYKMSLRRRLFTALTRLLSKFSKKKKSDDE